jgi:hypothetical protein
LQTLAHHRYLHDASVTVYRLVLQYLFGLLRVNFKPIWAEASQLLVTYAKANPELFWSVCAQHLEEVG